MDMEEVSGMMEHIMKVILEMDNLLEKEGLFIATDVYMKVFINIICLLGNF